MKRILIHLLVLAAAVPAADLRAQADAGAPAARVAPRDGKVTAPVEVEVVPGAQAGQGARRVRIVARPGVDAASLSIDVAAEDGLSLAAPAACTAAAAAAGEEVVCEVETVASGPGEQRLVVTATIKNAGGATQSGHHVFALNPGAALTRSFRRAPATDPGGRIIVEVPAARP